MLKKIGKMGILAILIAVTLLAIIWMTLIYSEVGIATEIGIQEPALPAYDRSSIPQNVISDAERIAGELAGRSEEKLQNVVDELLASYVQAEDVDVVIFFNGGGWGWNSADDTPGWSSILDGITSKLEQLGYRSLILNYKRTTQGLRGSFNEFFEAAAKYPRKAKDLSRRVGFLIDHLPDLKIIIAGESTGTVISDKTMDILGDKTQIYSIQTGTPFWYQPAEMERKLLMNSNGRGIDTFSYGNLPAMVWATFKGWFGVSSAEDNPGDILSWLKAPGHDYSWQYPGVSSAVIEFLDNNFEKKG